RTTTGAGGTTTAEAGGTITAGAGATTKGTGRGRPMPIRTQAWAGRGRAKGPRLKRVTRLAVLGKGRIRRMVRSFFGAPETAGQWSVWFASLCGEASSLFY